MCLRAVKRTVATSDELQESNPLDLFWIRPISCKTSVNPRRTQVLSLFKAAERQSGHHSPSVTVHRRWSVPTDCLGCQKKQKQEGNRLQQPAHYLTQICLLPASLPLNFVIALRRQRWEQGLGDKAW